VHQSRLAIERQLRLVAEDVGDAGVDPPGDAEVAREIGDGDAAVQRDVDVAIPIEDPPIGGQRVEVLDRRVGCRGEGRAVLEVGNALDLAAIPGEPALVERPDEVDDDLLALTADDVVDPRRLGEHLAIHEGAMDATQHREGVGVDTAHHLERSLGLIDRRRDGRAEHRVGALLAQDRLERVIGDVVRHRVDEANVAVPRRLERPAEIGHPRRGPVAGDLRPARVIIGMHQQDPQRSRLGR
jgi:hypothetical protein